MERLLAPVNTCQGPIPPLIDVGRVPFGAGISLDFHKKILLSKVSL